LFSFVILILSKDIEFKMCGTNSQLTQKKMSHSPDVIKAGTTFEVTTEGENKGPGAFTNGMSTTKTYYLGVEVQTTRHSICESMGKCPIPVGNTLSKSKTSLPGHAPRGTYTCVTRTVDRDGKQLGCVEWKFIVE